MTSLLRKRRQRRQRKRQKMLQKLQQQQQQVRRQQEQAQHSRQQQKRQKQRQKRLQRSRNNKFINKPALSSCNTAKGLWASLVMLRALGEQILAKGLVAKKHATQVQILAAPSSDFTRITKIISTSEVASRATSRE